MSSCAVPVTSSVSSVASKKPPVNPASLAYKELQSGPFWHRIPAYRHVDEAQFLDHSWQSKHTITKVSKLLEALQDLVSPAFPRGRGSRLQAVPDERPGQPLPAVAHRLVRPVRRPAAHPVHPGRIAPPPGPPEARDSTRLHEQEDAPVPGLTHRYRDKALFLALNTCPVYCRFCTRSYAVGVDTDEVEKVHLRASDGRWRRAYDYIASRPELEDILISGGDAYNLRAQQITDIGEALLAMPNIRRLRFATKGPAVMPQKILTDHAWVDALTGVVDRGRKLHKAVVVHTHFNHPREITRITEAALNKLFERGILVRNQTVLQRGVNATPEIMSLLVKRLGHVNVQPYYVYIHDLVKGVEDLRTTLDVALHVEKHVRGCTAGYNTPTFVVDTPGGGGKRDAHSYEHYDRETGISVYMAPAVKPGSYFLYFDPLHQLSAAVRRRWADPAEGDAMVRSAIRRAKKRAR